MAISFDLGAGASNVLLAADLDGNGDLDIVRSGAWQENSGAATPSFTLRAFQGWAAPLSVGDLDGDGDLDLVGGAPDGVHWFSNDGGSPRQFTNHLLSGAPPLRALRGVLAVDFDGDGDLDVLVAAEGPVLGTGGVHLVENRLGDASKWVGRPLSRSVRGATSVGAADLNGDGHMDALSTAAEGDEVVWHPWRGPPNVSLRLTLESPSQWLPFEPVTLSGVGVARIESSGPGSLERLDLVAGYLGNRGGKAISPPATGLRFDAARPELGLATGSYERGADARIPLTGLDRLCFLYSLTYTPGRSSFCVPYPLSEGGRGAGVGGTASLYIRGLTTFSKLSVLGAPWTVGTATATGYTPSGIPSLATFSTRGFAHGPLLHTGSTALPGGALQLVTPIAITDNFSARRYAYFVHLTVQFIPEPSAGAGLGTGALALAWLGRRRLRRRKEAD